MLGLIIVSVPWVYLVGFFVAQFLFATKKSNSDGDVILLASIWPIVLIVILATLPMELGRKISDDD